MGGWDSSGTAHLPASGKVGQAGFEDQEPCLTLESRIQLRSISCLTMYYWCERAVLSTTASMVTQKDVYAHESGLYMTREPALLGAGRRELDEEWAKLTEHGDVESKKAAIHQQT